MYCILCFTLYKIFHEGIKGSSLTNNAIVIFSLHVFNAGGSQEGPVQ